jgi:multiple sugar transport system permease protein
MSLLLVRLSGSDVRRAFGRGCLYFFVIAMCAIILYPFVIMATCAFRTDAEANDIYFLNLFPVHWRWENFSHILGRGVVRYLLNSLLLSVGSTCLALLCGIPAAYALARMRFRGRKAFLGFVIMSQMFSPVVLLVGISRLLIDMKLNDTLPGLVFINAAFNQAFAVWLLRGTFVSISPEMEQAACIDGCNSVSALIRVLLPMAAPGIVTTLIFVFINSWNEYTISTVIIHSDVNFPITVGLTQFAAFSMIQWNYLFAASLLATIPVVILFMFIEKHLTAGLTAGGVKG